MPKGVYRKKNKKGNWMYFRDGKLISKDSYNRSKASRKGSTKKGQPRKTARRAYTNNKGSNKMKRTIPHPSISGMASGLAIAAYLNQGVTSVVETGIAGVGTRITTGDSVLKDIMDGELPKAATSFANNAIDLISSDTGRKTLIGAGLVAAVGAAVRRQWPRLKMGGEKMYFRL